jgi:hypothetical protein
MPTTGAESPSEPARLLRRWRTETGIRETLALRKSLSPLLYLISVGLVATWVIGVFFGGGIFLLMHRPERLVSGLSVSRIDFDIFRADGMSSNPMPSRFWRSSEADLTEDFAGEVAHLSIDPPITEPSKKGAMEADPQAGVTMERGIDQKRQPANSRTVQAHAPVQAIQDVLQRRLLK